MPCVPAIRYRGLSFLLAVFLPFSGVAIDHAYAAETSLMIKVRLVRCVSQIERKSMCRAENMCCEYIDPSEWPIDFDPRTTSPDPLYTTLNTYNQPEDSNLWIRSIAVSKKN